ncbi:MAG: sigma-70 family RNA polymerase sigma factor [Verrucomicrobiota bacterium]|nr:sigma-70 family RNA polymerase sigma factor [Verrucomicrobiota bacterium]
MNDRLSDGALVCSYVKEGAEPAFRSLVGRHVDLVFATALRQVGDRGMAEEITQNVFVTLSRKAPRLAGYETLAGWLHKTTLFEARARIRSELRRKHRERTAAEIHALAEGHSPLEALVPILDEALLSLRENDRTAVISRFFEKKSLREVGAELGVDEDAARKRVSRALERLTAFFRTRGFAVPAGSGLAAVFDAGAQAAPAMLASSVAQCGIGAGAASGLKLLAFNLMVMSKVKTAVLCAAVFSVPILLQMKAGLDLSGKRTDLLAQIGQQQQVLAELTQERDEMRQAFVRVRNDRTLAEARADEFRLRKQRGEVQQYEWSDERPVVRMPKEYLKYLNLSAFTNVTGKISRPMIELLQLNEDETAQLQEATDSLLVSFQAVQARSMTYEAPIAGDTIKNPAAEERIFKFADVREEYQKLRGEYLRAAEELLGQERFEVFRKGLADWLPLDPESRDSRSSDSLAAVAHSITCKAPDPEQGWRLWWQIQFEEGSMSLWREPEEVPAMMAHYLQDWIMLALQKRSETASTEAFR